MLVVVDDLQFSDPTTLFALRVMIERLTAEPVVWAMATREPVRDEAVARTLDRLEHLDAVTFTIGELTADAATEVAQDLIGGAVDTNLQSLIARTGGHAVDLVETLRGLLDERRVQVSTHHAVLADTATPARLRDAINRRLDRLSDGDADIIAAAAVIGRRVTDATVAALADVPLTQAVAALTAAEDAQLVTSSGDAFMFRHDLIREIVESRLSTTVRRDLRRQAVQVQLDAGAPLLEVASALAATADPTTPRPQNCCPRQATSWRPSTRPPPPTCCNGQSTSLLNTPNGMGDCWPNTLCCSGKAGAPWRHAASVSAPSSPASRPPRKPRSAWACHW